MTQRSILFFFLYSLLLIVKPVYAENAPVIAVIKSGNLAAHSTILQGFKQAVNDREISLIFKEFLLKNADDIERIKSLKPDLILTIGTAATRIINKNIKDIPIVFSAIISPSKKLTKSKNMSGVSLNIQAETYIKRIKSVLKNKKEIGIIYTPYENEAFIVEAKKIAVSYGLILNLFPVNSTKDVPDIEDLDIDVLWIIPDTTVCRVAIIKHLLISSLRARIPVVGISSSYVRAGAVMALTADYEDIGKQTGEIALRILSGEKPEDIKISHPEKIRLSLNLAVADKIRVDIPEDIISEAYQVFGR